MPKTDAELYVNSLANIKHVANWPLLISTWNPLVPSTFVYWALFRHYSTQAQKREMAGYKSVISNAKSTPEAKAVRTELANIRPRVVLTSMLIRKQSESSSNS